MKVGFIACVGAAVLDQFLDGPEHQAEHGKFDCTIRDQLGGGVINTARQVRRLGVEVVPVALVGQDPFSTVLESLLCDEMPEAKVARLLRGSRRSVVMNGTIRTVRHALRSSDVPTDVLNIIRRACLTVISPMAHQDMKFVFDVISASQSTLLQMCTQQLVRPESFQLSRLASLTVVNDREAMAWTRTTSVQNSVESLKRDHAGTVLVTGRNEAILLRKGELERFPGYVVDNVKETLGAGDCLTGSIAASLARGLPVSDAVEVGLAAAALHVSGEPSRCTSEGIEAFQRTAIRCGLSFG